LNMLAINQNDLVTLDCFRNVQHIASENRNLITVGSYLVVVTLGLVFILRGFEGLFYLLYVATLLLCFCFMSWVFLCNSCPAYCCALRRFKFKLVSSLLF
jgi:heme O synthase-like polyprenyltransferase